MFKKSLHRAPSNVTSTTQRPGSLPLLLAALSLILLLPVAGQAQERFSFTASALGGVSGSFDASPDPGFGNSTFQLGFSWVTQPKTTVGIRLGQMDFGNEQTDDLTNADMTYVTFAGEFRMTDRFYQSGMFVGIGLYNLQGDSSVGKFDEEALGFTVGVTGDFPMTPHWSVLVELVGHWADLDQTQMFGSGLAGVAFRF